jgi:hypothetical protein
VRIAKRVEQRSANGRDQLADGHEEAASPNLLTKHPRTDIAEAQHNVRKQQRRCQLEAA